jgi:hypothetical protein
MSWPHAGAARKKAALPETARPFLRALLQAACSGKVHAAALFADMQSRHDKARLEGLHAWLTKG